jgi:hypothetical protein
MRPERSGVVGQVVGLFVIVRHREVVIREQALRDEQIVRLVSSRRELLRGVDRNRGDERERARDARCDACVEKEPHGLSIDMTQQPGQYTQADCNPNKKDDRTGPYEEDVRNRYRQPREQNQERPHHEVRDATDSRHSTEQRDGCRRGERQQPERCE